MKCTRCGARLPKDTRFCLVCGAPVGVRPHSSREAHTGLRVLIATILLLLIVGGTAGFVWFGLADKLMVLLGEERPLSGDVATELAHIEELNGGDLPDIYYDGVDQTPRFVSGRFSGQAVTNAGEAIASLRDVAALMQMKAPDKEFVSAGEDEYGGTKHFRLQQTYRGVEVYSKQLIVSADAQGTTTALSGDYDPGIEVDTKPAVEAGEALAKLAGIGGSESALCDNLVVYPLDEGGHELAWKCLSPDALYFVSAQSGNLLGFRPLVSHEVVEAKGKDNDDVEQSFNTRPLGEGTYELVDEQRNLYVYDAERETVERSWYFENTRNEKVAVAEKREENGKSYFVYKWLPTGEEVDFKSQENGLYVLIAKDGAIRERDCSFYELVFTDGHQEELEPLKNESTTWANPSAVTALKRVSSVYDWYESSFSRVGYDGAQGIFKIFVNDQNSGDTTNAYSSAGMISYGWGNDISSDVTCHEFTHSVESTISCLDGNGQPGALNEAYADIMACLFTRDAAWMFGSSRDLASPETKKNPSAVGDENWVDWRDGAKYYGSGNAAIDDLLGRVIGAADFNDYYIHNNCTVVGHAAYLMNQKGITMDDLEQIWYNSLFFLSSTADFVTCRSAVLASAVALGYDEAVRSIISDSFDEVNIGGSKNLTVVAPDALVEVLDSMDKPAKGIRMSVAPLVNPEPIGDVELPEGSCALDTVTGLKTGEGYALTFADPGDPDIEPVVVNVFVRKRGIEKLVVQTSFGKFSQGATPGKTIDSKADCDVALVLDVSGSMKGVPLDQTRKAVSGFTSAQFDNLTRIGLTTYSSSAETIAELSSSYRLLNSAINELKANGGTNIEDGLKNARSQLAPTAATKKIIVLMTDGQPTDGKKGEDLVSYANEIKDDGVIIFTVGFFEAMGGGVPDAQKLLEGIASEGFHYEVTSAADLNDFFKDIADQINGTRFVYSRIACPVDVRVEYKGETLDSSVESLATRTSFGTITFEETGGDEAQNTLSGSLNTSDDVNGQDTRVKILRLKEGPSYNVIITGTGTGSMDYTVGFVDDSGAYCDFRRFENIAITSTTRADTVAENSEVTRLRVDTDGDGSYDQVYEARANEKGSLLDRSWMSYAAIVGCVAVMMGSFCLYVCVRRRRKRRGFQEARGGLR